MLIEASVSFCRIARRTQMANSVSAVLCACAAAGAGGTAGRAAAAQRSRADNGNRAAATQQAQQARRTAASTSITNRGMAPMNDSEVQHFEEPRRAGPAAPGPLL